MFVIGYALVFGLLGVAALVLPGLESGGIAGDADGVGGAAPDARHWFGTNREGIDLLAPVLGAMGRSLWLAGVATGLGALLGLGLATGMAHLMGGRGCRVLRRFAGLWICLPAMWVALTLVAGHGAGAGVVLVILGSLCVLRVAGQGAAWHEALEARGEVVAARALGFSPRRILVESVLSGIWPRAASSAAGLLPAVLLAEAGLVFSGAGYGVRPAGDRIGAYLADGGEAMLDLPWLLIASGATLSVVTLSLAAFAWAVRRTLGVPVEERMV